MHLDIILQTESGSELKRISDPQGLLMEMIYKCVNENSQCLRFIDPYGNTIFNRLQMGRLLAEIEDLAKGAKSPEERALLDQIKELAVECRQEPHHYIKIMGE